MSPLFLLLPLLQVLLSADPGMAPAGTPLNRRYVEGEAVRYTMTGSHRARERTTTYTAEAEGRVVRDEKGRFVEEFRWSSVRFGGQDMPLPEASAAFRQRVSLDPRVDLEPPDVSGIAPTLIGPVFDLMTFYVDLHPDLHQGKLRRAGDRVRVPHGRPNSWADGARVLLGEDCIDFELDLTRADETGATLRVRHVPPTESSVKLPADWMKERVNPSFPNNWVQVQREPESGFVAGTGHEVFDVEIQVEPGSGRILSATMENPVDVVQRRCRDEALTDCGEVAKFRILRRIELRRVP